MSKIFNIKHFQGFTMGDGDLELEVLSIFIENTPKYLEAISHSGASKWIDNIHKLKGAARSIGAEQLASVADEAENEPSKQSVDSATIRKQYSKELANITQKTVVEINAYLAQSKFDH